MVWTDKTQPESLAHSSADFRVVVRASPDFIMGFLRVGEQFPSAPNPSLSNEDLHNKNCCASQK